MTALLSLKGPQAPLKPACQLQTRPTALCNARNGADEPPLLPVSRRRLAAPCTWQPCSAGRVLAGKLDLYIAAAGFHPRRILPCVIDVGTDNQALRADKVYMGLDQPRLQGPEYVEVWPQDVRAMFMPEPWWFCRPLRPCLCLLGGSQVPGTFQRPMSRRVQKCELREG